MRTASIVISVIGAIASEALMLVAGRTSPTLLLVLFSGWVLAPFGIIILCLVLWARWSQTTSSLIASAGIMISVFSAAVYGYFALIPQPRTPTFVFVMTPPVSCALILLTIGTGWLLTRSKTGS